MKVPKFIVKNRVIILIISLILMIPALFGMISTRVNYDLLSYLPSDIDTMVGQEKLKEEFGAGAFSFIIFNNMPDSDIAKVSDQIKTIDHVKNVLWYDESSTGIPKEFLPDKVQEVFSATDKEGKPETLLAVLFDTGTSEDATLDAISKIRNIAGSQAFVSGMSAVVVDLKNLVTSEQYIYVAIAAVLSIIAMLIFLDNWLTPFIFLLSIGMMILLNMGTNIFIGEISFVTMALSAVLQLAVTMDYSIFLWHSYKEQQQSTKDKEKAMATAIKQTFSSVVGSSITTIAGFIALMFMTFTLGFDLGLVMAKGVIFGVIGCVTVLPALILVFDRILEKTSHRPLLPDMNNFASKILRFAPAFVIAFIAIAIPSFFWQNEAQNEVYYDMGGSLPKDMEYVIAETKLEQDFHAGSTDILLIPTDTSSDNIRQMSSDLQNLPGIKYVLGLDSLLGERIPTEILPDSVTEILKGDNWQLMLVGSEYKKATNAANTQAEEISNTIKRYNDKSLLIGEAPATKDMIKLMAKDFQVVNSISIVAIFLIIALVLKSLSLPFILIAVIEVAIFINLAIAHLTGTSLPFIAPICISTIQLGATVDYAILMTTRYKTERIGGKSKHDAVRIALATSIPSVIVSSAGLFVATLGVAIYSNMDMISSICMLLARGAIISMLLVITVLPALLSIFDKIICNTTKEMKKCLKN
ncbi:MMPL family transporter [Candidatus Saccharibacteria bacterium]|nr:MMPL family transporter [Candidatus Saccharibacteria bacterium]